MLRIVHIVESLKPDPIPDSMSTDPRPVQDEWGIYDPEQAGFEAVLRKLGHENEETAAPAAEEPSDK